jgi:hypothetical protein
VDLNGSFKALLSTIARLDSISVSDPVASREEKGTFSILFPELGLFEVLETLGNKATITVYSLQKQ